MAITFPRTDILSMVTFDDQKFSLMSRQELSRQANGRTRGKDFGSAIWMVEFTTSPLTFTDALKFEAALNSLDGVIQEFEAYDLRRPYPLAYRDGVFNDTGTIHTLDANNKALRLTGLPAGLVLSVGDMLAFNYGTSRALHQIVEAATADGAGLTPLFEVRPHLRPGAEAGAAVVLKKPSGRFVLAPASVESQLQGSSWSAVTFKAVQSF